MRIIAFCLALLPAAPAWAVGSSAGYGGGGQFARFDPVVAQYNQSGELFRIAGRCQSSCTLFLAIRNVCIERSATVLFHAGHDRSNRITAWGTQHLMDAYKPALQSYLTANHAMDTLTFTALSGGQMIQSFGYPECPRR